MYPFFYSSIGGSKMRRLSPTAGAASPSLPVPPEAAARRQRRRGGSGGSAGAMRLGGVRQLWRPDLNLGSIAVHVAVPSVPEAIGLRVGLLVAIERAALELLC